ncbi:TPA: Baculoviral IAP repeat-containing protein 6 [Trebouxia sp. C0006]
MGYLDDVIVISDDDEGPSQPRRSKRLKTGTSPSTSPMVLDMTGDDDVVDITSRNSSVDIMGNDSADVIDLDKICQAGPSTPARDKGKGISMSPQQQALQASHAIMQRDAGGVDREELRHWLETTAAGLPCNLPQQLQHLTHAASSSAHAGKEQGPVTRRDMLALLPARTVNKMERSIYDAASRAVQHQRNPDGRVKQDALPAERAVHDAASTSQPAAEEDVQPAAEQLGSAAMGGGGGRVCRGARKGKRAASSALDQETALSPTRGGSKGKRRAAQPELGSAQQAKQAQHVLKRLGRERAKSCPLCLSATTLACDKLDVMSVAELKLIMGHRGLTPGKGHKACVDMLTANCQGLCNICPLCHGSLSLKGDVLRNSDTLEGAEARWADVTVQQCLDLCSNVDLVYKLLIQEIQPVLAAAGPPLGASGVAGRGRGRGGGGRGGGGRGSGALADPCTQQWQNLDGDSYMAFSGMLQHGQHPSSNGGWAKGTGYGGPGSYYGMQHQVDQEERESRKAAGQRQQVVDEHLQHGITAICNCLEQATGQNMGKLIPECPPMWVTAVLYGGPFAASLRLLLQNDSVMDIGSKGRIYGELLRLLNVLGSSMDLVALLYEPADFEAQPKEASAGSPDPKMPESLAPNVVDALHGLSQQCIVFKKSAEQLACGSTEDIGALSLVLQIIDASQELQQTVAHVKKLTPSSSAAAAGGAADKDQGLASTDQGPTASPAGGTRGAADRKKNKGKQAAAAAAAGDLQVLQTRYVEALRPKSFSEHDLMDPQARFYFREKAIASKSAGGEVMRKWLRRVSGEHASLSGSLPLTWTSSIFLAADPSRLDLLRALIIGPADTPYANGCFLFDIFLPSNYPSAPPSVHFLTTGGGLIRFNPNLYECGKVCLSLLGTWSGPSWDPTHSTLLQVLISIQSMILVDDPYFNEPGYESSRGSTHGKSANDAYNRQQQHNTLRHALLPALKHPDPCFVDIIKQHFQLKTGVIQQQMQEWLAKADKTTNKPVKEAVTAIKAELERLSVDTI